MAAVSLLGCLDEPSRFFEEAARVLAPGGFLIFTLTNRKSLLLRASRLLGTGKVGEPTRGNIRLHSTAEIVSGLNRAGFEIEERRAYHFVCDIGVRQLPSRTVALRSEILGAKGRFAWLGRNTMIVARRAREEFRPCDHSHHDPS